MKIVIIEDETPASEKLQRYLLKYDSTFEIVATLTDVESSVALLKNNLPSIDLIFMDIQLTDGLSFEIFTQVQINKPVIFTTAYDEYAIDAFKVNSIAYLLKPVTFTELSASLKKFDTLKNMYAAGTVSEKLSALPHKKYKDRFLVKKGNHIQSVKTEEIMLFYADGRTVFLLNKENQRYIIDYKMEALFSLLDPKLFFRTNRSVIMNINGIKDVVVYSSSRFLIKPVVTIEKEVIVSREKVSDFKEWMAGG